jgi:hypothetical protein
MPFSELNDLGQKFLLSLYKETKGDITVQKSMYEIGSEMGLDREEASKLTEDLMGWSLVEIRTLSGGVAITSTAVEEIEELGYLPDNSVEITVQLGSDQLVSAEIRLVIEQLTGEIKQAAGGLGLPFESLSELMTDLKTIDVQLDSTRPKTAILRECLRSIKPILDKAEDKEIFNRVGSLLGD